MASISTTTSAAVQATTPRAWLVPGAMIAGIGGPLVLAVCNTLVNFTPDWRRAESTADGVNATIAHPVLAEFIIGTGIVAVLLIVPGIWAVAARLAPRTPVLAAIGGWMMATGYICALVLSTSSLTEQKIALSGLDPESFGKAFDAQWPMGQIMIGAIFGFSPGFVQRGTSPQLMPVRSRLSSSADSTSTGRICDGAAFHVGCSGRLRCTGRCVMRSPSSSKVSIT